MAFMQCYRQVAACNSDPLAGLTAKQVFIEAVWLSDERTYTKLFLLCLARFFDRDCRSASMSYGKIALDCGFSETTSKRCAKDARDRWLRIDVGKGFHVIGKGRQNLYRGVIPTDVLRKLREHKLALMVRQARYPTDTPVAERGISRLPQSTSGVSERAPKCESIITHDSESWESQSQTTESAAAVAPPKVAAELPDLKVLEEKLLTAANGSMANPAAFPGNLSMTVPIMWIESGADLERDVLPTLKAVGAKAKQRGQSINNWNYFTGAIAEAKRMREVGLGPTAAEPFSLEAAAEAWLKTSQGKMAIDIYGGREQAKQFWVNQRQKGTLNA